MLTTIKPKILSFMAVSLLFGCATSSNIVTDNQLTGEELKLLLSNGKQLILGDSSVKYSGQITLNGSGAGEGQVETSDGKTIPLRGTWKIIGNEFCRKWEAIDNGSEICEKWVRVSEKKVDVYVDNKRIGVNSW